MKTIEEKRKALAEGMSESWSPLELATDLVSTWTDEEVLAALGEDDDDD